MIRQPNTWWKSRLRKGAVLNPIGWPDHLRRRGFEPYGSEVVPWSQPHIRIESGSRMVREIGLLLTVIGLARSHLARAAMTGSVRIGAGT